MARYERNRGMFFASWSGICQDEEYSSEPHVYSDNTIYYADIVDISLLRQALPETGRYLTEYNSTNSWDISIYTESGHGWNPIIRKTNGTDIGLNLHYETFGAQPKYKRGTEFYYTQKNYTWEAIGKDNDSLLKELNPDTEKIKNVLGEMAFKHKGYQPEISVDRYYIDPNRKLYKRMALNALEEKHSENDLKGFFAEAFFMTANKATMTLTGYCFVRQGYFIPQSTGGDTSGLSIPFSIVPIGAMTRMDITYNMQNNEALIRKEEEPQPSGYVLGTPIPYDSSKDYYIKGIFEIEDATPDDEVLYVWYYACDENGEVDDFREHNSYFLYLPRVETECKFGDIPRFAEYFKVTRFTDMFYEERVLYSNLEIIERDP